VPTQHFDKKDFFVFKQTAYGKKKNLQALNANSLAFLIVQETRIITANPSSISN
jgi:hypothetical protein